MQAIETKYIPATNTKPSRIKAIASAGSVTIGYHDCDGYDDAHRRAAIELCRKFGWSGEIAGGTLKNGSQVWVIMRDESDREVILDAPGVCPVCLDSACETKSAECGT